MCHRGHSRAEGNPDRTVGGGCIDEVNAWPDPAAVRLPTSPGNRKQINSLHSPLHLLTQSSNKPHPPRRRTLRPSGSDPPPSRRVGGRGHAQGRGRGFGLQDTRQKIMDLLCHLSSFIVPSAKVSCS